MKEVQITAWCDDPFQMHEERVKGEVERQMPLGKPVTLDLCGDCSTQLTNLEERIEEVGTEVKAAPTIKGRAPRKGSKPDGTPESYRTCPECLSVKPNRSALGQHLYQHHHVKLTDYEWEYDPRAAKKEAASGQHAA